MLTHIRLYSILLAGCLVGCANSTEYAWMGAGTTAYLSQAPANEIEQVYYLGVFDPQDQVPPTIYRLTVRGQASALSQMKFGSGWLHSSLIDSLETKASFSRDSDRASIEKPSAFSKSDDSLHAQGLKTGRRLVLFGPEGFREAPKDHRLVIVMGASPDKFFGAMDQALSFVNVIESDPIDPEVVRKIIVTREQLRSDQQRLLELKAEVDRQLTAKSN